MGLGCSEWAENMGQMCRCILKIQAMDVHCISSISCDPSRTSPLMAILLGLSRRSGAALIPEVMEPAWRARHPREVCRYASPGWDFSSGQRLSELIDRMSEGARE